MEIIGTLLHLPFNIICLSSFRCKVFSKEINSYLNRKYTCLSVQFGFRLDIFYFQQSPGADPSSLAKGYDSGPPSLHPWRI